MEMDTYDIFSSPVIVYVTTSVTYFIREKIIEAIPVLEHPALKFL